MKFSIRGLLALTALVAVLAATLFVFPDVVAAIFLLIMNPMISAALVATAVYGRRGMRAFCIGAVVPTMFLVGFHTWVVAISAGFDASPADLSEQIKELGKWLSI